MTIATKDWYEANYQYLMASVNQVASYLQNYIASQKNQPTPTTITAAPAPNPLPIPFALDILCSQFNLSELERDILLMCVGMELDPDFPKLITQTTDSSPQNYPTLSLALAAFPKPISAY